MLSWQIWQLPGSVQSPKGWGQSCNLRDIKSSGTSACFYLKAPSVTELSVEIEVHFCHQKSVLGSGEARGAAAVRSGHVAGSVEMPKVVMRCTSQEKGQSVTVTNRLPNPWKQSCYLFFHHRMWIRFWNVPAGMRRKRAVTQTLNSIRRKPELRVVSGVTAI